ncbi:unnamed protein product [Arctogadus glacialis]
MILYIALSHASAGATAAPDLHEDRGVAVGCLYRRPEMKFQVGGSRPPVLFVASPRYRFKGTVLTKESPTKPRQLAEYREGGEPPRDIQSMCRDPYGSDAD